MRSWRDDVVTVAEVAERFGLHVRTVERYCREGRIPATKLFGKYLIHWGRFRQMVEDEALSRLQEPVA